MTNENMNKTLTEFGRIQKVREFAINAHASTNHRYGENDEYPYKHHLELVAIIAGRLLPLATALEVNRLGVVEENLHIKQIPLRSTIIGASWCHDTIEDARMTYNDLVKASDGDTLLAEIVYALTNDKGRSRKDRAGSPYYLGIRTTPYASFVKLCDRIANIAYSISRGSRMVNVYKDEMQEFHHNIIEGGYDNEQIYDKICALIWHMFDNADVYKDSNDLYIFYSSWEAIITEGFITKIGGSTFPNGNAPEAKS